MVRHLFKILCFLCVVLFPFWIFTSIWDKQKNNTSEYALNPYVKNIPPNDITILSKSTPSESVDCNITYSVKDYFHMEPSSEDDVQKIIGYQNNKFGLYIYSTENFIKKADELINSNGGDWGYVLIPYNVRDYDETKWKKIFGLLNSKHLIPIIQLWDVNLDSYQKETKEAVEFLDNLQWPIKNRYVSVYNEPNDARFWKDSLDPEGYARILNFTIDEFKKINKDFFLLNGAFNSTAPSVAGYMDEVEFMRKMNAEIPGIFEKLDGWASHPYPQPGFVGLPTDRGRASIRAYEWELDILNYEFKVNNLPVFITETGWPHSEGTVFNYNYYDAEKVADYIKYAFEKVWLIDDRVVSITPFTVYYDPPYDNFSWVGKNGEGYKQFQTILSLKKVAGKPPVNFPIIEKLSDCGFQ